MLSSDQLLSEGAGMLFGKEKSFERVKFPVKVYEDAFKLYQTIIIEKGREFGNTECTYSDFGSDSIVAHPDEDYRRKCFSAGSFHLWAPVRNAEVFSLRYSSKNLSVILKEFEKPAETESILKIFNDAYESSKLPPEDVLKTLEVFIGHGRSRAWKDLRDHLRDQHGIKVIAYETGSRAGYTIQEILKELSTRASFALLVHTGEDETKDGQMNARENVIHETGLFQGKLGFRRAIILKEDGTHEFSNIAGLQHLPFSKDNIKEVFGGVIATIQREFSDRR